MCEVALHNEYILVKGRYKRVFLRLPDHQKASLGPQSSRWWKMWRRLPRDVNLAHRGQLRNKLDWVDETRWRFSQMKIDWRVVGLLPK